MLETWEKEKLRPKLLIHGCCGPCSSTVLEILSQYADLILYFYNPNIHPEKEYRYRALVQKKFVRDFNKKNNYRIEFLEGEYEPELFFEHTEEEKEAPEGGKRCFICYRMRLENAVRKAVELACDYFTTTLTLSPMKNSRVINEYGLELQEQYPVRYLPSDFKKNSGYQRSIELSREYFIYRQRYCGCIYGAQKQGIDMEAVLRNASEGISRIEKEWNKSESFSEIKKEKDE